MNILIVGSEKKWALENIYSKHLKSMGHRVELFPAHDLFYDFHHKNIGNKLLNKFGLSTILRKINSNLIEFVEGSNYDALWVFKGMELYPETLIRLKKTGILLVNFNTDHPYNFVDKGSGNSMVTKGIPYYDIYLSYSREIVKSLKAKFHVQSEWFPFGYESDELQIPDKKNELIRLCFVGNPDEKRIKSIQYIVDAGIPVDVFGNNWNKYLKNTHNKLNIFEAIYNDEFRKISVNYRLQLNIFRKHNEGSHNMRSFDMPGLGAIMLAPRSSEHEFFYKENEHVFLFESKEEMLGKIRNILDFSYEDSVTIRNAAFKHSIESNYSYFDRAKQFINIISKLNP